MVIEIIKEQTVARAAFGDPFVTKLKEKGFRWNGIGKTWYIDSNDKKAADKIQKEYDKFIDDYKIDGNTYAMKDVIKGMGCKWNDILKCWVAPTVELKDTIQKMVDPKYKPKKREPVIDDSNSEVKKESAKTFFKKTQKTEFDDLNNDLNSSAIDDILNDGDPVIDTSINEGILNDEDLQYLNEMNGKQTPIYTEVGTPKKGKIPRKVDVDEIHYGKDGSLYRVKTSVVEEVTDGLTKGLPIDNGFISNVTVVKLEVTNG